jgi:hypothetical protein
LQKPSVQQAITEGENAAAASGAYKTAIASKHASAPSTLHRLWFPRFKADLSNYKTLHHHNPVGPSVARQICRSFVTLPMPQMHSLS